MDEHNLGAAPSTRAPVTCKTVGGGLHKARRLGLHKILPASARRAIASRFGARLNSISPGLISPGPIPPEIVPDRKPDAQCRRVRARTEARVLVSLDPVSGWAHNRR